MSPSTNIISLRLWVTVSNKQTKALTNNVYTNQRCCSDDPKPHTVPCNLNIMIIIAIVFSHQFNAVNCVGLPLRLVQLISPSSLLVYHHLTHTGGTTCFLCDSPADVVFQPCGHSVMCSQCAARAKKCPTCRVSYCQCQCIATGS